MPLYEYECKKCHHRFERIVKFSDPPMKKCPDCGGQVEQMISAPAVQFKGSGWYVTDYAKKSGAAASSNGSGTVTSPATEQPTDYSGLLIKASDIGGDLTTPQPPVLNPNNAPGVAQLFANADNSRRIGDTW